jgi:hypothetical protein
MRSEGLVRLINFLFAKTMLNPLDLLNKIFFDPLQRLDLLLTNHLRYFKE